MGAPLSADRHFRRKKSSLGASPRSSRFSHHKRRSCSTAGTGTPERLSELDFLLDVARRVEEVGLEYMLTGSMPLNPGTSEQVRRRMNVRKARRIWFMVPCGEMAAGRKRLSPLARGPDSVEAAVRIDGDGIGETGVGLRHASVSTTAITRRFPDFLQFHCHRAFRIQPPCRRRARCQEDS